MRFVLTGAALALSAAAPAAAFVTYDAFSSFNGTNTAGGFIYGVLDSTGSSPVFAAFSDAPSCAARISGTICTSNGDLPAVFKSTSGAHHSGTVIVPANALIFHPGPNAGESAALLFVVPTSSRYKLTLEAFVADNNPSGATFDIFIDGAIAFPLATLSAANPTYTFSGTTSYLPAGLPIGVAVNYDGLYNNDSTGVNFTATAVPEPAAWTLMIAGFAMTGFAARRRSVATA